MKTLLYIIKIIDKFILSAAFSESIKLKSQSFIFKEAVSKSALHEQILQGLTK